jgi:spore maturation protein CgeB
LPPLDERFQRRIAENAQEAGCAFRKMAGVCRFDAGVLSTMPPAEVAGVNGRLFQATGCGAAVLTELRRAVPGLFTVGDEVLAFRDFDEVAGQATRLLNETGLTARLGAAAARRAHRDHTYELRVTAILEKVS